ncbi:RagB/SusD family nutrient uptake outer membrane protein [Sphingobacterium lactis]|uniref:RagB/SusD family nutrient uptake outer membrane protein n=1 Tax=Sphingobacterium lactis TaxID=797291 RepID=UPI003DA32F66
MKLKNIFILGLVSIGFLTSCDLDLTPYNVIDTELSFTSVSDAQKWDTRFYADLRGRVYGHYIMSPDVQADQLNAVIDYGNNYGAVHRWNDFLADSYEISNVWSGYYGALSNVNTAIQGFDKITPKNAEETEKFKAYKGDAHLARAYYYFMLVNRFAKTYNATTANTDLGVPLILVPDINAMPKRNSVKETFDQILADLAIAKTNLAAIPGKPNANRFTIDVVHALEARVKLAMGDWNGAKAAAETVLKKGNYTLYKTEADLKKMWHNDAGNEVIFASFTSFDEGANANSIYLGYMPKENKYRPAYIPSQWVYDAYEDGDFRKGIYFLKDVIMPYNGRDYKVTVVNKYPGNPEFYQGTTNYRHTPKIFRVAELYLIAAEAAYKGSPSSADALTHLNTLRTARGLKALSSISGNALWQEIKAERFRELAFEGFRLDDLKRWGEGFTRRNPQQPSDLIQVGPEFDSKTVPANHDKFVWGIPDRDDVANPNIEQNKGW